MSRAAHLTRNDPNRIGRGGLIGRRSGGHHPSPADAQRAYKVRFTNGGEATLRRAEFSILKEFKAVPSLQLCSQKASIARSEFRA